MRITIKPTASVEYIRAFDRNGQNRLGWANLLKLLADNKVKLKVETNYLFDDQFNVAPLDPETQMELIKLARTTCKHSVPETVNLLKSKDGYRIMNFWVADIENDIRPTKFKCDYCGKACDNSSITCPTCHKAEYLRDFRV